ncbi:MAG: XRE family transcriptional regulator [Trueperaceae bacterium]
MAKPFRDLTKNFSKERKATIAKETQLLRMEYDLLAELRKDQELTQKELADILEIRQSAISKLESQEDIMVRTLGRYIKALGGELEVRAKFPDRVVMLGQFTRRVSAEEVRHP